MPASIARRALFAAPLAALPAFGNDTASQLADLERRNGGCLGVAALATVSGRHVGHRADELFPLCSTFKSLAAALVLARVERGEEQLDRRIVFSDKDLVTTAPPTILPSPGRRAAHRSIAAYYTGSTIPDDARNAVIAESARVAVSGLG